MKRIALFIILWSALLPASAQEKITFTDLESMFLENNPLVKTRKAELKIFDGRLIDAGQRPNPSLNTSVESLSNGSRETETSVSISQEVDWNNKRRWRLRSLEHQKKAQSHQLSFDVRSEVTNLKKVFCKIIFLQRDIAALEEVVQAVQDFEEKSKTRLAQGDVSEVDILRLSAEKKKVLILIDNLKNEAEIEKKGIVLSLGVSTQTVSISSDLPPLQMTFDRESLVTLARSNRDDIKASKEKILGTEASTVAAKKELRYPITLEGGYKGRTGGFNGFVFGLSAPLPWSHRNQGKIAEFTAERNSEQLRIEAAEKTVIGSIDIALEKMAFLDSRGKVLAKQMKELQEIIRIARFAYEEGEVNLIEVLDAVRSQSDVILEENRTTLDAWSVVLDLENITGTTLTYKGGNK